MKKHVAFAAFLLCFVAALSSQTPPRRQLTQASLDRLLADFVRISGDAEASEIDIDMDEAESYDPSLTFVGLLRESIGKLKKDSGARAVLARYGWGEEFWDLMFALTLSYYAVGLEAYGTDGSLPPEMKAQYEEVSRAVHPDDKALVYLNFDRISAAMGDEGDDAE